MLLGVVSGADTGEVAAATGAGEVAAATGAGELSAATGAGIGVGWGAVGSASAGALGSAAVGAVRSVVVVSPSKDTAVSGGGGAGFAAAIVGANGLTARGESDRAGGKTDRAAGFTATAGAMDLTAGGAGDFVGEAAIGFAIGGHDVPVLVGPGGGTDFFTAGGDIDLFTAGGPAGMGRGGPGRPSRESLTPSASPIRGPSATFDALPAATPVAIGGLVGGPSRPTRPSSCAIYPAAEQDKARSVLTVS